MKRTLGLRPYGRRGTVALVSTEVPEESAPVTSKKNTRRWCRGKERVEHAFIWRPVVLQWDRLPTGVPPPTGKSAPSAEGGAGCAGEGLSAGAGTTSDRKGTSSEGL